MRPALNADTAPRAALMTSMGSPDPRSTLVIAWRSAKGTPPTGISHNEEAPPENKQRTRAPGGSDKSPESTACPEAALPVPGMG